MNPEEISLDTSTHSYSLYKLDDIKNIKEEPKEPRRYYKAAFFVATGFIPFPPLYTMCLKSWLAQ